jgi:hypothetical protein
MIMEEGYGPGDTIVCPYCEKTYSPGIDGQVHAEELIMCTSCFKVFRVEVVMEYYTYTTKDHVTKP